VDGEVPAAAYPESATLQAVFGSVVIATITRVLRYEARACADLC
jgi:hypothetical protein